MLTLTSATNVQAAEMTGIPTRKPGSRSVRVMNARTMERKEKNDRTNF